MLTEDLSFDPNWFSPPGVTIQSAMHRKQLSTQGLASELRLGLAQTRALLLGDLAIDNELATKLVSIFGGSEAFWCNRQTAYERSLMHCLKLCEDDEITTIANRLPVKHMRNRGWLNPNVSQSAQALAFYNVRSPQAWTSRYGKREKAVAFRQSAAWDSDPDSTFAWLRQAERLASLVPCQAWNREGFKSGLNEFRSFTKRKSPQKFFPDLVERCSRMGVAVVFVPTPKGCPASGATFFADDKKAVMVLSFRHLTDDQFWFSFFHEAAHLILHDERALFLEDSSGVTEDAEREANEFAANLLVPKEHRPELKSLPPRRNAIIRFAVRMGVSPGVVVGQMQYLGVINHSQMNVLKRRYSKSELIESL